MRSLTAWGGANGDPKHFPPVTASPAPSTGEVRASNDCHLSALGGDGLRRREAKALARKRLGGPDFCTSAFLRNWRTVPPPHCCAQTGACMCEVWTRADEWEGVGGKRRPPAVCTLPWRAGVVARGVQGYLGRHRRTGRGAERWVGDPRRFGRSGRRWATHAATVDCGARLRWAGPVLHHAGFNWCEQRHPGRPECAESSGAYFAAAAPDGALPACLEGDTGGKE
jgi:hypothetical protein